MRMRGAMLLVVGGLVWLLVSVTVSAGQRTYQRHCECEYSVDGRCAYTLLLPTMNSGEMACPLSNSSASLSRLQDDVSALRSWTGEHAKAVVTLHNTVNTLTAAVQLLQDAEGRGNGKGESRDSRTAATDAVKAAVDQLNRTVVELTALCRGRCGPDTDTKTPPDSERQLVTKYRLCAVRGLIINTINDSAITASSVNEFASTSDVRINDSDSPGWCPSDPGESL